MIASNYAAIHEDRLKSDVIRPAILKLSILTVLLLACYYPMLLMTGKILLLSEDMAHGFFAPIVALSLVWIKRDALLRPAAPPSYWSLPVLFLAACIGIAATLAISSTFSRLGFLVSLAGCLLLLGGWPGLRELRLPLLLLLFTFPIPGVLYGELTQPLQLLATRLSEISFELLGFSVVRDGNILQLAYMNLSVAEACSGLRSMTTLLFFCLIYGYFFETRLWLRAGIALLAVPAAILANAVRITSTGVLGKFDMAWTQGVYHQAIGWCGFLAGFLTVFLVHRLVLRFSPSETPEGSLRACRPTI